MVGGRRPVLVGEANPRYDPASHDPEAMALYPLPAGASGDRLCRALGLSRYEYLRRFERVNLCLRQWNLAVARERARWLLLEVLRLGNTPALVLCGSRVAGAFGVPYRPWSPDLAARGLYVIPHPSGRSRAWSEAGSVELLRAYVAPLLAGEVP